MYDISRFTEINNITGILLLIYFGKAFDSISKSFLFEPVEYINQG